MEYLDSLGNSVVVLTASLIGLVSLLAFIYIPIIMDNKQRKRDEKEKQESYRFKVDRETYNKIKRSGQ